MFIDDSNSFDFRTSRNFIYERLTLTGQSHGMSLSSSSVEAVVQHGSPLVRGTGSTKSLPNVNLKGKFIIRHSDYFSIVA